MKIGNVEVHDHTQECIDAKNTAIERALEAIGIQAESRAKTNLTRSGHIDTGLLRNSIAHAVSGNVPTVTKNGQKSSEYEAERAESKYKFREARRDEQGNAVKEKGEYTVSVPDDAANQKAVYVGSNVEYAPYIEYGTDRISPPTHFIKDALADHGNEYKQIAEQMLKNV